MSNEAETRLVRVSPEVMAGWATRTDDGYRLRVDWGEADADGFYSPTLTIDYHDDLKAAERRATVERLDLEGLRDHGYQPMYNGRPSCPFCLNFVDDEETHTEGCELVAILDAEAER